MTPRNATKVISVSLTYEKRKDTNTVQIKKIDAELELIGRSSLRDVLAFEKSTKKIFATAHKYMEDAGWLTLEINEYTYIDSPSGYIETVDFNSWEAAPYHEQDNEGIHLLPDTRYTPEHWDMYIRYGHVLEDLAEALH